MKRFFQVLLFLVGLGAIVYIVTQKQTEARRIWDEVLAKIPTPDSCRDCCSTTE